MAAEQHFHTPGPVRLEIKVAAGELELATVDGEESTVALEGPQSILDAISVELVGDRLAIGQRRRGFSGLFAHSDGSLRVRARVPHRSRLTIVTASAEAAVEGVVSELEVKSASGGRPDGLGDGERRFGRRSASMKSVSGNLRVGWLREGSVNAQSVSGDVELGIASGTSIDVDARSASGELSSEVPLSGSPGADPGPTLAIRGNTVSGDFRIFRAELAAFQ